MTNRKRQPPSQSFFVAIHQAGQDGAGRSGVRPGIRGLARSRGVPPPRLAVVAGQGMQSSHHAEAAMISAERLARRGRASRPTVRWPLLTATGLLAFGLGCGTESDCGSVTIAEMTWASAAIAAHVQNIVLDKGYGCLPELVPGDTVATVTAMSERGEPDVAPEVWMNSVRTVIERSVAEGRLRIAGDIISDGGIEGWFVPEYLVERYPEMTTLDAVRARPDLFPDKEVPGKGRFYSCPPGWACQIIDTNLFRAYEMEEAGFLIFNPGSGEGLSAAIARAYERREPIFTSYWSPTSLLTRYKMRRLSATPHDPATWACVTSVDCDAPARNMYPKAIVQTVVTSSFAERSPEAFDFVSRFSWTNAFITELLTWKDEQQATALETAEFFLREHAPVWREWVRPDIADRVQARYRPSPEVGQVSGSGLLGGARDFPALGAESLRTLKKTIDDRYRSFSREYGDKIEGLFDPLLRILVVFEEILIAAPWWLVIVAVVGLCFGASRSIGLTAAVGAAFLLIGYLGMWEDTMRTLAMILVSTLMTIAAGIPFGIAMARSDRAQAAMNPLLDIMQTMPIFVYLIPVVMLFGLGKIPGLIAVVIYAVPPVIRLTNLGIRLVNEEVLEAAEAFGTGRWRRLVHVELPLAMPNIMAGINQTIMMALSMVVIASMIGVRGLGQPVLQAVTNQYFALGLFNGAAVVALAIVFDRITQSYGRRLRDMRHA